jgi:hypothetical protein
MNTKYGRIKNGQIEYAPSSLETEDGVKINPTKASYLAAGWKKVVDVKPTAEAGYRVEVSGCLEDTETVTCVYKVVAGEAKSGIRIISKLKLVAALKEADKWVLVKTWLEEKAYYDFYLAAQNFSEDYPLFQQGLAALKSYARLTDEEVEAILAKCVAD